MTNDRQKIVEPILAAFDRAIAAGDIAALDREHLFGPSRSRLKNHLKMSEEIDSLGRSSRHSNGLSRHLIPPPKAELLVSRRIAMQGEPTCHSMTQIGPLSRSMRQPRY